MTESEKAVCELLGEILFRSKSTYLAQNTDQIDWDAVYQTSKKQTVLPTVAGAVPETVKKELRMQWVQDVYSVERRNFPITKGHFLIHDLLTGAGIPYVILKGLASVSYYPAFWIRNQGDVDFLVPQKDLGKVKTLLVENGFVLESELPYEIIYLKDNVSYELHLEVNGIPEGPEGTEARNIFSDIFETSEKHVMEGHDVVFPDAAHHGLILLLHMAKHMVSFGVGLRQLCDWAVYVDHLGDSFPEIMEEVLKRAGMWKFARALSAVCVRYLHMPDHDWIGEISDNLSDRLMSDILRKGGIHHDENDDLDNLLIEKTDQGGVGERKMLPQLMHNLGEKAKYKWPFMRKTSVLIPFGVVIMCIEYFFGMLFGKYKKINPRELVEKASERKHLYGELGLFSSDEIEN